MPFQDRIHDDPHSFQDLILTVVQKVCELSTVNVFQLSSCVRYVKQYLNRVQKYFHAKILTVQIGAYLPTPVLPTLNRKVAFRLLVKKLYLGIKVMSK